MSWIADIIKCPVCNHEIEIGFENAEGTPNRTRATCDGCGATVEMRVNLEQRVTLSNAQIVSMPPVADTTQEGTLKYRLYVSDSARMWTLAKVAYDTYRTHAMEYLSTEPPRWGDLGWQVKHQWLSVVEAVEKRTREDRNA